MTIIAKRRVMSTGLYLPALRHSFLGYGVAPWWARTSPLAAFAGISALLFFLIGLKQNTLLCERSRSDVAFPFAEEGILF